MGALRAAALLLQVLLVALSLFLQQLQHARRRRPPQDAVQRRFLGQPVAQHPGEAGRLQAAAFAFVVLGAEVQDGLQPLALLSGSRGTSERDPGGRPPPPGHSDCLTGCPAVTGPPTESSSARLTSESHLRVPPPPPTSWLPEQVFAAQMVGFCLFDPTQGALPALTRAIMAPTAPALTWTLQGGFTGPTSVHSSSPPTQHLLERRHTLEPPVWFCQTERRRSGIRRPFRSSSSRRLDTFGVKKIKSTATNLSTTTRRR